MERTRRVRDAAATLHTFAHFLADTEEEARAELAWDLLALEAATGDRGAEDREAMAPGLASFLPSLHLNVGDAYRRTGERDLARDHAVIGLRQSAALADYGYGAVIKAGLERLEARLWGDVRPGTISTAAEGP